jgi:hypothetical protein
VRDIAPIDDTTSQTLLRFMLSSTAVFTFVFLELVFGTIVE